MFSSNNNNTTETSTGSTATFLTAMAARAARPPPTGRRAAGHQAIHDGLTTQTRSKHTVMLQHLERYIATEPEAQGDSIDINIINAIEDLRRTRGWRWSTTMTSLISMLGAVADLQNRAFTHTPALKHYIRRIKSGAATQARKKAAPMTIEQLRLVAAPMRGAMEFAFWICGRVGNLTGIAITGFDATTHCVRWTYLAHKTAAWVVDLVHNTFVPPTFRAAREWLQTRWTAVGARYAAGVDRTPPRLYTSTMDAAMEQQLRKLKLTRHSMRRGGAHYRHNILGQPEEDVMKLTLHTSAKMFRLYLDELVRLL